MDDSTPIYTIGYGTRTIEDFVKLLRDYGIDYIVDIRSHPFSSFRPEFSREQLEEHLAGYGIRYVFMGDTLGGQPDDELYYTNGRVDYAKCSQRAIYSSGIARLERARHKQAHMALMCSEGKPQECHRSKLIGETLLEHNIRVLHVDEHGIVRTQEEVISCLTSGQLRLFDQSVAGLTSKKRHAAMREGKSF